MAEQAKLYKVLMGNKSYNGGDFQYSLPRKRGKGWQAGQWHEAKGNIEVCSNGFHLTTEPFRWYKWGADIYEAEGAGDWDADGDDKTAFRRVRLLKPVPAPQWITDAQDYITKLPGTPWFKNDGNPNADWKLYPTRAAAGDAAWDAAWDAARDAAGAAARDAARDAAWAAAWDAAGDAARAAAGDAAGAAARDAAGDAAWDAAGDAALYTRVEFVCAGLNLEEKHREHARARWEVWAKGYGLLCDVDGALYVYEKVA
jgi:hypothetical protein